MASIDASGYAKATAAMAAGVERLGRGMASLGSSITAADNKAKADQSSLELAHANSQYSIANLDTAAGAPPSGGTRGSAGGAAAASDPYSPSEEVDTAPVTGGPTPTPGGQPATQGNGAQVASPGAAPTASSPDVSGGTPAAPQADQGLPQQEVHAPTSYARSLTSNPDIDAKVGAFVAQITQYAQGITDPLVRQKWLEQRAPDVERYRLGLMKQARSTERDNQIAYARANQSAVISRVIATDDEAARAAGIDGQMDVVNALVANKYMTAQQGQAWKSQFINDYATAIGLASEHKGPDAVNKTISEVEQARLNAAVAPTPPKPSGDKRSAISSPMEVAKTFLGKEEHADNQVLASFIEKSAGKKVDPAQTAWCAAFLNAALGASGLQGTGSLMAKSFLNYGSATDKPSEGDIVVLSRGDPKGPYGHVGLFAGYDENGNVKVLAGNQGNRVSVAAFPAGHVIGFRKPPSAENAPPVTAAQGGPVKVASLSNGQTATDASGGPIPQQTGAQTLPGGDQQVAVMADQPTGVASPGDLGQAPGGQTGQPFQVAQAQRHPTIYDAMDPLARERLLKHMHGVREVQQTKASAAAGEQYEKRINGALRGNPGDDLPTFDEIRADKRLSPTHLNVVEKQLMTAEGQLESATMHRAVAQMTPTQMTDLLKTTEPPPGQENNFFLQKKRAAMATAMNAVNEARQKDPMGYAQGNGIANAKPMDWKSPETIGEQIGARTAVAAVMREKYQTPYALLSKPEAETLKSEYDRFPPEAKLPFLQSLRKGVTDDRAYRGLMQQIAPDSPVTAVAGSLLAVNRDKVTPGGLFSSETATKPETVARLLVTGEALINPTKAAGQADGKGKTFQMPPDKDMHETFAAEVGDAFAGNPGASHVAYQAARAYYAGKTSEMGAESVTHDAALMKEAVQSVTGGVSNFKGNGKVIRPWGLSEDNFEHRIQESYNRAIKEAGLPGEEKNLSLYSLRSVPGGGDRYVLQLPGFGSYLADKTGKPVVLDITGMDPRMWPLVPNEGRPDTPSAPTPNTIAPTSIKPEKLIK